MASDQSLDIPLPSRDTAPFIYDVLARTGKGAAIGLVAGLILFKGSKARRFSFYYGAGFGLGMSSSQITSLYNTLIDDRKPVTPAEKLEDLEKELNMH